MLIFPLKPEVFAEVRGSGLGVFEELVDGAGHEDLAIADEVAPIDDGEDLACIVVGDENADPFTFEVADHCFDVIDGDGVDIGKGFIEEQERGLDD